MSNTVKIKIAIPATLRDQLKLDISDYGLKGIGELCNCIIENRESLPKSTENRAYGKECNELFKNCQPLQFTLHKRNASFAKIAADKGAKLASLCRHYIEQYVSLPRGKRELFVKKVELIKIEEAIKNQRNISLAYRGSRRLVSPCFIANSPAQVRSYLVVCENPNAPVFRSFRICHIKNVTVEESVAFHTATNALFRKAEGFREHFDPFLCYGQELRVELSREGVKLYKKMTTNRPKILRTPGEPRRKKAEQIEHTLENEIPGVYIMECSPDLAKVYFPQFLETAEIITPTELRNYFRQRFLKAAQKYGIMDFPKKRMR